MPRQHLKRRKDGRFACRYQGKWFYGLTEGEAFAARDAYKQMLKQGIQRNADSMDVRHYAASWLPIHKADVSKKHYNDCAHHIDILCDQIGGMLIKDVKPSDIKAVYSAHYLGLSASTINVFFLQSSRQLLKTVMLPLILVDQNMPNRPRVHRVLIEQSQTLNGL